MNDMGDCLEGMEVELNWRGGGRWTMKAGKLDKMKIELKEYSENGGRWHGKAGGKESKLDGKVSKEEFTKNWMGWGGGWGMPVSSAPIF